MPFTLYVRPVWVYVVAVVQERRRTPRGVPDAKIAPTNGPLLRREMMMTEGTGEVRASLNSRVIRLLDET
jgi:hypothetical protein